MLVGLRGLEVYTLSVRAQYLRCYFAFLDCQPHAEG